MKHLNYPIQLVINVISFLFFSFLSGIVGSYAIEYTKNPSIIEKTSYAFKHSSYPYIACVFLIWAIFVITIMFLKHNRKKFDNISQ